MGFLMAVDTALRHVEAQDLRAGMVVRLPADFKHPAGDWLTVEVARRYGPSMLVRFTNLLVHHPKVERVYEVKP
jgi:hypothetical protein